MSFGKYWRHFVMAMAAFFWAGCDNDSSTSSEDLERLQPIGDRCDEDGFCGGGMIALYGVAPVYDFSSSSVESSDSCDDCDDGLSSSSGEMADQVRHDNEGGSSGSSSDVIPGGDLSGDSDAPVDSAAAMARGEAMCEEHGGMEEAIQYEPPWMSGSLRGDEDGREEIRDSVAQVLDSEVAKSFSQEKRECLQEFSGMFYTICLYGAPLIENNYDIWKYKCKDGEVLMDEKYAAKQKEFDDAYAAAKEEAKENARKEAESCDDK